MSTAATTHLVTKQQSRAITEEISEAISAILSKHGLAAPEIKTTYGDYYQLKIKSTPLAEGPNGVNLNSPEAQAYLRDAEWNDALDPKALGRKFTVQGGEFIFSGSLVRGQKYVYAATKVSDGKSYRFTRDIERFLEPESDEA